MEQHLVPGDPILIEEIVKYLKAKGIFDEFRHECLADVDTKSSCQNLSQRVDGYTTKFLSGEKWHPDLNKNELRNKLRRHIDESGMLAGGADHVVEQVINPKINQLFLPKIIEVVHQFLNEAQEKLNKKKESSDDNVISEKPPSENNDGANKTKSAKLDPIADILSFSYSKPKSNSLQNVQNKVTDLAKTERKKEENVQQTKIFDVLPKTEKKKDELINPIKAPEVNSKAKKEDTMLDVIQNVEKDKEECTFVKVEPDESIIELPTAVLEVQTKSQNDSKEPSKIKKEIKIEESEASSDTVKKLQKEDIKSDKKKDDLKASNDLSSYSEEGSQNKVLPPVSKSTSIKSKSDAEKSKKIKTHSSSKSSSETQKFKTKDSDKIPSKSSEKHKSSSKILKMSTKEHSSPLKNSGNSKSSKSDKTDDNKNKSKDSVSKVSDNSTSKYLSSKSSSSKKEGSSMKIKHSSDKAKISKSFGLKPKTQSDTPEKINKSSLQYSSYDSSQGSDQDRSSTSSSQHKEKHKHFSKHHKKESNKKSSEITGKTPEKKRFQSDSDSGTPKKHISEKEKKKLNIQESAKISSRSNSFGSTSSVSDSPSSSSKETSASASDETSDNSLKSAEAKRKQEGERCKKSDDFPPPPPPPPTSGISAPGSSSAEISSMDETQSSQDSESDSKISDESSSESDVENLYSSNSLKNSNLHIRLKTPEILNDIFDVFLYSSSSSEFEGYSSTAEKEQSDLKQVDDVYVSSVHTSELSSFDNFLSESECSNSDIDEHRPVRRLTLQEAEKLLEEKARQRRLEKSKNLLPSKGSINDKKSSNSPPMFSAVLLSEDESTPVPEPKRESRRERKLNPKYASSDYTSIFNTKKTSFITKHASPNENKTENISPATSETDIQCQKDNSSPKRRISMGNLEANQLPDENVKKSPCSATGLQTFEFPDNGKRKLSLESKEESSWTSETKIYANSHERNHNMMLENTDSHIALKIKKSVIKNDNAVNKEPRPQGLKRKLVGNEKGDAKKLCRRNSDNSSSSESVPNENNPFNIKTKNSCSIFNMEPKKKGFFHKQKINNNGAVLKMEHVQK